MIEVPLQNINNALPCLALNTLNSFVNIPILKHNILYVANFTWCGVNCKYVEPTLDKSHIFSMKTLTCMHMYLLLQFLLMILVMVWWARLCLRVPNSCIINGMYNCIFVPKNSYVELSQASYWLITMICF